MNDIHESPRYRIKRIRLVNFHNFQNETIDIGGGGHLFLLGDNGSGKTTVLDAVHYVLTGGNHMEFNSAARVAGSRQDGRRVQGIVLRYNVDTGPLNPGGGISYAAVELSDEENNLLTIGVGLSAFSLEERVQRWGIIIPQPLEEVPWLTSVDGRTHVTSQREMRDALIEKNAYYTIGAYEKEIARRLFTNDDIFAEICRFLAMGKAYREIAASAADYHALFKTLLPEPKTDLFERVIQGLRSLDEANNLLEEMEKKLSYLSSLENAVKTIDEQRECIARYQWLKLHFERTRMTERVAALENELEKIGRSVEETDDLLAACQSEQIALQRRIADMRNTDGAGLIRQEKELDEDLFQKRRQQSAAERSRDRCETLHTETEKLYAGVHGEFIDAKNTLKLVMVDACMALALEQDSCGATLDSISETDETVIEACRALPTDPLLHALQDHLLALHRDLDKSKDLKQQSAIERDAVARQREDLEKNSALKPAVEGLETALQALADSGFRANLLYELLEWNTGLDGQSRAAIEECIGMDVLSTIIIPSPESQVAAQVVFAAVPGIRVCTVQDVSMEIPEWIRISFDLHTSQPAALVCLAHEMLSHTQPEVHTVDGRRILSIRSHSRRLFDMPSCWIGQEERRIALQAKLADLGRRLLEIDRESKRLAGSIATLAAGVKTFDSIRDRLIASKHALITGAERMVLVRKELSLRKETLQKECDLLNALVVETGQLADRLEALRELILREGLEELESAIARLQEQEAIVDKKKKNLLLRQGGLQERRTTIQGERHTLDMRDQEIAEALLLAEQPIRAMLADGTIDIPYYVLRTRMGAQFKSMESIDNAIRESGRREAAETGTLLEKLRDPVFGAIFGFHYDAVSNRLTDRRERTIGELTAGETAAINEQRHVINERTTELFKKIIVNEMVSFFARHISRLEQMVRTINSLLAGRTFGTTRYRLEIIKEDKYAGFIDAVKKFNPFSPGSEDALKQFIDDHREEILNTEADTIPDVLDYRYWYTYHLRMYTAGTEGIIIDRRTKSVGSGGEQAVPNYLTILTIAHFLFKGNAIKLYTLLFDEAFYGIDAGRRDQLMGFASDLDLQLLVASPDQDGVRREIPQSTTILVVKDARYDVHLYPFHWNNPREKQLDLFDKPGATDTIPAFEGELTSEV